MNSITIPLPEGWELAEPEPRNPEKGEYTLAFESTGEPNIRKIDVENCINKYYIVRKTWTPPASCPKGTTFVFADRWVFTRKDRGWSAHYDANDFYTDFTPPPYSPYTVK